MDGGNVKFSRLEEDLNIDSDDNLANGVNDGYTEIKPSNGHRGCVKKSVPWRSLLLVVTMFGMVLIISFNKKDINTKYNTIVSVLNKSALLHNSYKTELQRVGGKVNVVWNNLSRLDNSQEEFRRSKPWLSDLNVVKSELYDKISEVTRRLDKTDSSLSKLNNSMEHLKLQVSKNSQFQAKIDIVKESVKKVNDKVEHLSDVFHQKLDHVVNNTRDMSVVHATMTDNVYQMLSDLDLKQEVMEEEIETYQLSQEMKNEDLQLEILKLESALNISVSHWADMKTDHNEFANKTLAILANIRDIATQTTTEANDVDDSIDSLDVIEESDDDTRDITTPPSSVPTVTPQFYNCTNVKKFKPQEITCSASSELNRRFGCSRAFDGNLSIGKQKNAWASLGEGVGAWIEAKFEGKKAIHQLKLLQRLYPGEANKKIELKFGKNGPRQIATLPAKGDKHWNIIKLSNNIVTDSIKITIKEVYGTVNNGFKEIQIFGCPYSN